MRCPRCDSLVMPGVDECFACGASLAAPAEPVATMPAVNARAPGLLDQRKKANSTADTYRKRIDGLSQELNLFVKAFFRAIERFVPPFWVGWAGMALGAWFFARRRYREGAMYAGLIVAAMVLVSMYQMAGFAVPGATLLLVAALLAAAFSAIRHHQIGLGYGDNVNTVFRGLFGSLTALSLVVLIFLTVPSMMLEPLGVSFARNGLPGDIDLRERGLLRQRGNLILARDGFRGRDIKPGDLIFRNQIYTALAGPGDVAELRDCEIYVNGKKTGYTPLFNNHWWEERRCEVTLEPHTVPEDRMVIMVTTHSRETGVSFRFSDLGRHEALRLLAVISPLNEWRLL